MKLANSKQVECWKKCGEQKNLTNKLGERP